jgi:hypothetical protein
MTTTPRRSTVSSVLAPPRAWALQFCSGNNVVIGASRARLVAVQLLRTQARLNGSDIARYVWP